jgi:hypothetical protein
MNYKFNSNISLGAKLKNYPTEIIKNEPMFFNCDWEFAFENGGEPTKEFLLNLPKEIQNKNTIIDSRVHMLMENWFPCIPGFHHDDVERDGISNQPNYDNPTYRAKHCLVLFNGEICPTEFALGEAEFPKVENNIVYKVWHPMVIDKINNNELISFKPESNQMIYFDDRTWHQGTKTIKNGWRLFIRATWETKRKPTNEIRKQVQVYLENPMEGW